MLREPRGYPAANCNLILPSTAPRGRRRLRDHGAGRVPGDVGHEHDVRGDGPARDRDAPDDRARHRADARGAGRPHPRPRRLRRRQGRPASRSATCPRSRPTSTRRSRCPHLGTVTVDVAYGGMFYVIADAERFGLRLTPDEGADIVRITEMIKAAANEQLPVVHPGAARVRRHHHRAAVGAGARPGEQPCATS